jgi:uncharacterized protein
MTFTPMKVFICKIASRCNLDCDYCYVYHHIDQTWRKQPTRMSLETAAKIGQRVHEHALTHGMTSMNVTFHGGEPFLLGLEYIEQLCRTIIEHAKTTEIEFYAQTNGTLFTQETLDFCRKWNIKVGVSCDGPRAAADLHRFDHQGKSSFDRLDSALTLLATPEGQEIWQGFLTVVDLRNDPVAVYEYLRSFNPKSIEFLWPLSHHDLPPPGMKEHPEATLYADWMHRIFELWYRQKPYTTKVRRFRDIIALSMGARNSSEEWGLQPVDFLVIEANGEIQAVDTLKVTFPGACELGLNVFEHSIDEVYKVPQVIERQERWSSLCQTCRECEFVKICGGGYFPHRYSSANGYANPSVYCADLKKMITSVMDTVKADLATV